VKGEIEMKQCVKVALVQFSPLPMEQMQENIDYIISKIEELASNGNKLIVFPEMSITNFYEHGPRGKQIYWENGTLSLDDIEINRIIKSAKEQKVYVIVSLAERSEIVGTIYNSALLIGPSGIIGKIRKMHLPGLEKLYFSEGSEPEVFDTPIGKIGIAICYDSMFPEYVRLLAAKGAEIIAFPSSIWKGGNKGGIGSSGSKEKFWNVLPLVRALENQCFVIACNGGGDHYIGEHYGRWIRMGLSKIVSPTGEILAETHGNENCVLEAIIDKKLLAESRSAYPFLADRKTELYGALTKVLI
jgi:predicted amidohydrolase